MAADFNNNADSNRDGIGLQSQEALPPRSLQMSYANTAAAGKNTTTTGLTVFGSTWGKGHVLRLAEFEEDDRGSSTDSDHDSGDGIDFEGYAKLFHPHDPYLRGLIQKRRQDEHDRLVDKVMAWDSHTPITSRSIQCLLSHLLACVLISPV